MVDLVRGITPKLIIKKNQSKTLTDLFDYQYMEICSFNWKDTALFFTREALDDVNVWKQFPLGIRANEGKI